ncbi:enoyl-CoA hydratase/carnithine racemase [Luteibacter sp. Sphag1AF]|uniref:enoyl-CoA hydratase/isomerase family protein n=1 Tax=Luteibacter sp. Sphag1AF TaxID=2587031 RepID=UPI001616B3D2|nr:enoyl-CoA hydratase/isomerase family protein [Luteibacter sp. Sphag1AF]MBB3225467.1 enoyl-CoA hydratase/carnithine racemase [Luteibacter sp. Sphag1AF]
MIDIFPLEDGIHEIRLARPPVNALNVELVRALRDAVTDAPANGAQGIVISGAQGMFSAGVDVPALLVKDRAGISEYWREFFLMCGALANSQVPIVAAVTGHSPAGGAVIALFCDYRVMAHGPFRIGLNEVQVGLPVPEPIQLIMRRTVGAYRSERLLTAGAMLDAEQALAVGLVDELVGVEQVTTRATVWLRDLLAMPRKAMLRTRAIARADLTQAYADPASLPIEDFVDAFLSEETQSTLKALVAKLKAK